VAILAWALTLGLLARLATFGAALGIWQGFVWGVLVWGIGTPLVALGFLAFVAVKRRQVARVEGAAAD